MTTYSEYSNIVFATTSASVDSDAQSLINRMIALGEEPSSERKTIINNTFLKLKGDNPLSFNFWAIYDTFGATAAHLEASSRLCWKNATYNLTSVTSPTFTIDRGFLGDVFSSSLRSAYNPTSHAVHFSQNSGAIYFYNRVNVQSVRKYFDGGATVYHIPRYTDNKSYFKMNEATEKNVANSDASGFFCLSRTGSTGFDSYRNKTKSAIVQGSTAISNQILIMLESSGVAKINQNHCLWGYMGGLTEAQENALEDIWVGYYLTQIGAAL